MKTYTLATKHHQTGEIIHFGPLMSIAIATRKQAEMMQLVKYDIFVINTKAI